MKKKYAGQNLVRKCSNTKICPRMFRVNEQMYDSNKYGSFKLFAAELCNLNHYDDDQPELLLADWFFTVSVCVRGLCVCVFLHNSREEEEEEISAAASQLITLNNRNRID